MTGARLLRMSRTHGYAFPGRGGLDETAPPTLRGSGHADANIAGEEAVEDMVAEPMSDLAYGLEIGGSWWRRGHAAS
jgi:hypothetical protein